MLAFGALQAMAFVPLQPRLVASTHRTLAADGVVRIMTSGRIMPSAALLMKAAVDGVVPLEKLGPSPTLEPREVISSVMAALHRSNWDSPTPFYGFEVALRFLAPTHQAKQKKAKPAGFSRFMRQPHKVGQISWNEYRFEGPVIELKGAGADGCDE
eukprot:3436046-Prymnesium_polylepis.1